jgi:hypothetical protein
MIHLITITVATGILLVRCFIFAGPLEIVDAFLLAVSYMTAVHTFDRIRILTARRDYYRSQYLELYSAIQDYMRLSQ